jgi:putative ABC transport system permease protein
VPALVPSSTHIGAINRAGVGGLGRLRSALLVAQITLTTALVGTTALLLQSGMRIASIDPGFDPRGVVVADVDPAGVTLAERRFDPGDARYRPIVERIRDDVAALPGVDRVAVASAPPFSSSEMVSTIRVPGRPDDLQARQRQVGTGYFEALGIRLVAGRGFEKGDPEGTDAVIVDEVYRDRYLRGLDPLTQYVEFPNDDGTFHRARIVGVARTVRHHALDETPGLATTYTLQPAPRPTFWLVARTSGNARELADTIRRRVLESEPGATLVVTATLSDRIARTLSNRESLLEAIGAFAAATLALSMIGLAAVLGFAIRRRTAEIGLRIALGATPGRVRNLVLRQGAVLIACGIALGLALGLAFARLLADRLFGIAFTDHASWSATLAIVAAVALLACWWPARRAAATDPIEALRHD